MRDGGPFDLYAFSYDDGTSEYFVANRIGSAGWQYFDVTANLNLAKNLSGFLIYGTSSGPAYLDDFAIQTRDVPSGVPEPASWALLVSGLGLVGARMRVRRNIAVSVGLRAVVHDKASVVLQRHLIDSGHPAPMF